MPCGPRWTATPLERIEDPDSAFVAACATVRNAARTAVSAMAAGDGKVDADKRQAAAAVQEVFDIAERMAALKEHDVVWVADRERFGREARVSPLSVVGADAAAGVRRAYDDPHLGDLEAGWRLHRYRGQRRTAGRRADRGRRTDRSRRLTEVDGRRGVHAGRR